MNCLPEHLKTTLVWEIRWNAPKLEGIDLRTLILHRERSWRHTKFLTIAYISPIPRWRKLPACRVEAREEKASISSYIGREWRNGNRMSGNNSDSGLPWWRAFYPLQQQHSITGSPVHKYHGTRIKALGREALKKYMREDGKEISLGVYSAKVRLTGLWSVRYVLSSGKGEIILSFFLLMIFSRARRKNGCFFVLFSTMRGKSSAFFVLFPSPFPPLPKKKKKEALFLFSLIIFFSIQRKE